MMEFLLVFEYFRDDRSMSKMEPESIAVSIQLALIIENLAQSLT